MIKLRQLRFCPNYKNPNSLQRILAILLFLFLFSGTSLLWGQSEKLEIYYDFTDASNYSGNTFYDSSGNGRNATLFNSATYSSAANGLSLNGTNQYLRTIYQPSFFKDTSKSFSIRITVTPENSKGNIFLVADGSTGDTGWNMPPISSYNNKFYAEIYSHDDLVSQPYNTSNKYTITLVYDADSNPKRHLLYINDTLASQANLSSLSFPTNPYFFIGKRNAGCCNDFGGGNVGYFKGTIHDFSFYSVALDAASLAALNNETPTDISLDTLTVNENVSSGTTVGSLSSTDPDSGDTFTYTLVSGSGDTDNASFAISGANLNTNTTLD